MNRRRLLRAGGPLALAGFAGCIGGQQTDTPTGTPDGPETPPSQPPSTFTATGASCGQQVDRAAVAVDDGTVTVEGTTWGNDACYTARLESVTVDGGTLTLRIAAERRADAEGCAQCITELGYRATVEVGGPPTEVVVVHRGERVTTARP